MRKITRTLLAVGFGLALMIGLVGCSDKPPKYDGEKAKVYGEKLGNYYGDKLKDAGAENIRKYISESKKAINNLQQNIQKLDDNQMVEKVDNTIEQLVALSDEYLGITEDDYKFFANPLKYYDLYNDYDNFTQAIIGDAGPQMWSQMTYIIGSGYGGKLYSPFDLQKILKNLKEEKYYYVLKNTKYKTIIADNDWLKDYEAKKLIVDMAIKIAKQNKLYFDTSSHKIARELKESEYANLDKKKKLNSSIKKLQKQYMHNVDVFVKTYNNLKSEGFEHKTIMEFLSNGWGAGNSNYNPENIKNVSEKRWQHNNYGGDNELTEYLKTMKKLLK